MQTLVIWRGNEVFNLPMSLYGLAITVTPKPRGSVQEHTAVAVDFPAGIVC